MNRALAAWFTSWSRAMLMKSMIMTSATGRRPAARRPDRGPDDGRLGDRRVPDPIGAEGGRQALGHLRDAAARVGQVLADEHHGRVGGQRLGRGPG